jgi:hypothetical protein
MPSAIHAELTGNICTALGITARGPAPVLALCRKLIEAGHDPSAPLHAYRGDMIALRVRSIGEGAGLTVEDNRFGTPVFRRWRDRGAGVGSAPPVRRSGLAHPGRSSDPLRERAEPPRTRTP